MHYSVFCIMKSKLTSCIYQHKIYVGLNGGTICEGYFKNKKPEIITRGGNKILFCSLKIWFPDILVQASLRFSSKYLSCLTLPLNCFFQSQAVKRKLCQTVEEQIARKYLPGYTWRIQQWLTLSEVNQQPKAQCAAASLPSWASDYTETSVQTKGTMGRRTATKLTIIVRKLSWIAWSKLFEVSIVASEVVKCVYSAIHHIVASILKMIFPRNKRKINFLGIGNVGH